MPLSVQRSLLGDGISVLTASAQLADEPPTNRDHLLPRRRFDLSTSMKERTIESPELVAVLKPKRYDELPKLNNNQLRPVQSLLQLERKRLSPRRPNADSPPDTGRKTDTSSTSGDNELLGCRINDSMLTVTTGEGYSVGLAISPPDLSNHSIGESSSGSQSHTLIFPDMVSTSLKVIDKDFLQSRLVQENNKLPSLIATVTSKTISCGSSEQRMPAPLKEVHGGMTEEVPGLALSFVFEETHHHLAGDLFYSTYIPSLR